MSIQGGTAFQFLFDQGISGIHDVENDTLFFAMYTTAASIDPQTVNLQSALTDELVGVGYTAGGAQLTQTAIYTPGGPNRPALDFADLTFASATWGVTNDAAQGGVIYNTTAGPQQGKVMWVINFVSPIVVNGGDFTIRWPDPTNPALAMVRLTG